MVSTELLRRFPFFGFLSPLELREVAFITDEIHAEAGSSLFEMGEEARSLFFLIDGEIELHYIVIDEHEPQLRKDFLVGTVNPGEVVGISAIIPPHRLTATAYVLSNSHLLRIDAWALRELCKVDHDMAVGFDRAVLKATMERLQFTRIQLAAATAPL
ncbi:MAG: Crp/Fnr family transcriptional regulator [Ardenticatenaceae bacterium]|nr:Crp/Fnr family transcriptional regulator [Ardenticatenaceae bacterium]